MTIPILKLQSLGMHIKISIALIALTLSLHASTRTLLCFTSTPNHTFCPKEQNSTIILNEINNTRDSIYTIQSSMRKKIDNREQLIVMAENYDATLLAIAQGNLLPYYRKSIRGLVLKRPLESKEFKTVLSISKQMDWYGSKCLVIDSNKTDRKIFREAFERNGVQYTFLSSNSTLNLESWFPLELKCKIEPEKVMKKPNYYGAILHLNLNKILYKSKHDLVHKISDYGFNSLQKYDIFYKRGSRDNPLFIYVHGGDWKSGDREDYFGLCQQYADRGYTAISVNYRLLDLPEVGMREMVEDVKEAIVNIMKSAKSYSGDRDKTVLMADSAGAMLSYMALSKLSKEYQPKRVVFNTLPTNFALYSKERQTMLSGVEEDSNRSSWIEDFSPLSAKNLEAYTPATLVIQNLDDNVTVSNHLESLEVQSVIHNNNIHSFWLEDGFESKHQSIEERIDSFLLSN